ncbi:hypothetical protein T02_2083 [Trichinella nativa]|uniref:Uncharacterized protein n=1 Tax=Trichinella nativa TaxID=6335 RepID=A0A0V1L794_9BILA|nr:hypothetical protein T02_2083 [Trichinella nativa]
MASGQTPRCLTACCPTIRAANISFMAKLVCPPLIVIARVGRIALHKLVQNSSRDALADRKFIKPLQRDCCWPNKRSQAAFSDCTSFKVPLLTNPCPNMLNHIFAPLLTTNESDTFSSRAGGSSCQSATSLPISEYLCTQYFIKASNFQSVSECEWCVFLLSLTIRVEED